MFEPLTEEQQEGYLEVHNEIGTHCPRCKSTDFYADNIEAEANQAWQKFNCNQCEGLWTEVFILSCVETPEDLE